MRVVYYLYEQGNSPSAAWGRVRLIIKGLQSNGIDADVYPIKTPFGLNKLLRPFILLWQVICLYFDLFWDKENIIVSYGFNYTWFLFFLPHRAKIYVERNEYPNFLIRGAKRHSLFEFSSLKRVNGFITCTYSLKNFYSQYCPNSCSFFILPVIVDVNGFSRRMERVKKITYCGDWGNNKDGVDILIKAFSMFHEIHPGYKLELIGGSTIQVENSLKQLARDLGVDKYIDFVGRIPHEKMSGFLLSASVLALARPNNKQAEGGFPCKVAEYLATGIPVVITRVGDLPLYLKDHDNCYMAEPDSPEAFATKLGESVDDPLANQVGMNGHELSKNFDYIVQSNRLKDYLAL